MAQHRSTTRRQETITAQPHTPPAAPRTSNSNDPPRRVGLGRYKSFRLQKKSLAPAYEDRGVPGGMRLLKRSLKLMVRHWWLLGGVTLIFGVINFALAGGSLSTDTFQNTLTNLADKDNPNPETAESGDPDTNIAQAAVAPKNASVALTLISLLISSGGGNGITESTTAFQFLLFMLAVPAIIWCLRQIYAGKKATIRGAWYFGTASLVPFVLVLAVILLECVPAAAGSYLVSTLIGQGITVNFLENSITLLVFLSLATISCYWVSGSIFALQIVTLPNMMPIKALRTSHELVRYRRALVLRRLAVFALAFVVVAVFVVMPLAITYTPAAPPVFFVLLMLSITAFQAYLYNLYRELIG